MNVRSFIFFMAVILIGGVGLVAAQVNVAPADSATKANGIARWKARDAAFKARQKFVTDSIMTHTWLFPDSAINRHLIIDSIIKANTYNRSNLINRYKDYASREVSRYRLGTPVPKGQVWVPAVVTLLLILFATLKISFAKQLQTIVQSFFSNRVLNNLNR